MPRIIFKLILPWILSLTLAVLLSHVAVSFPHAGFIPCHIVPPIDLQAYPLNLHLQQTHSYPLLKPCVNSSTALSPHSTLPSSLSACIHTHRSAQQTRCLLHSNSHSHILSCIVAPLCLRVAFIAVLPTAPHAAKASTDPRNHHQRAAFPSYITPSLTLPIPAVFPCHSAAPILPLFNLQNQLSCHFVLCSCYHKPAVNQSTRILIFFTSYAMRLGFFICVSFSF